MSRQFTEEQNQWIRENYRTYGKHYITEAFNQKFNDCRTLDVMWCKVRRMGLTGNGDEYKAEMCKKHFSVPIGSEHICKDGRTLVKFKDDKNGRSKNWKLKERYLWEQTYGEIPEDHFIIFLDNDFTNYSMDNLMCVPKGMVATFAKKGWKSENAELTKAAVLWMQLFALTKSAENGIGYQDEQLKVYCPYKI